MSKIKKIKAMEILDSRGNPTIECEVFSKNFSAKASVPSGASTGTFEAFELRDGDKKRFFGKGVLKAISNIEKKIAPEILEMSVFDQKKIDQKMIDLDGTENKKKIGANAILAVSLAVCRLASMEKKIELHKYISQISKNKKKIPKAFFNIINGGNHAGNKIAIQEFMICPNFKTFEKNYRVASEIYQTLKKNLEKKFGLSSVLLGDEGGFAPNDFEKTEEVLEQIQKAISDCGYKKKVDIGLDVAASEFFSDGKYDFGFKQKKKEQKNQKEMIEFYQKISKKYPIISIEDPFNEDDFSGFSDLKKVLEKQKIQIVTDDLTTTNPERIKKAIEKKSANCLLLKINQIGTVSESLEAFSLAKKNGWKVMVSHRSGETCDDFIADFAVGVGADQIKSGAPARGERVAKYNRILEIEKK